MLISLPFALEKVSVASSSTNCAPATVLIDASFTALTAKREVGIARTIGIGRRGKKRIAVCQLRCQNHGARGNRNAVERKLATNLTKRCR
jgi:hypothetical protein